MSKKLFSRGNIAIDLFNKTRDATSGYKEDGITFEWIKRNPLASFSYAEFMNISRELINLTKRYQGLEPKVEILGFSNPQDCLIVHSLSGGQDDETAHSILDKRNSYSLEDFAREDYERNTEPTLALKSEGRELFMFCLTASAGCKTVANIFNLGGSYISSFISKNPKKS